MNSTFAIGSTGYLNKKVELMEDTGRVKKGAVGICTADLADEENDVFAVRFLDYGWIAFHGNVEKEKFKVCL
jgi:hypothetical protein